MFFISDISYAREDNWVWCCKFFGKSWRHGMPSCCRWTCNQLSPKTCGYSVWGCICSGYSLFSALPIWNHGTGTKRYCGCNWIIVSLLLCFLYSLASGKSTSVHNTSANFLTFHWTLMNWMQMLYKLSFKCIN